ncbi:SpoIIE family protein phosphatase [Streptomyces sp. B-S-A6]|uniref:SpoIIE family protein phosphatase n=1 Tax=Streptomyces cavernicola TaxID=3043613 RepID=A0ABT6SGM0_9ACTN|nr:SpoIIE family protein phosphatase [Streptomyces sp. B-S-A6]MDI3406421.1 SpoIIE family protein phosphatase [Streptomyces sp. B-S-A6]
MRNVAGQVLILQLVVFLLLVVAALVALVLQAQRQATDQARREVLAVAETFANSPGVVEALDSRDPTAVLQPLTEKARKLAGVDSIVVFSTEGIRYTHPDPKEIGKHVVGPFEKAAKGTPFTNVEGVEGPIGLSVYAEVPVFRPDGSVAGIVSPEIRLKSVRQEVTGQLPLLFGVAAGALLLAMGGSALVSRRLLRQTHGLGPAEITRMFDHHEAVLHSVREGVLITGADGRLLLANDEARRLLELPETAELISVSELGLPPAIAELLASGRTATDELQQVGERILAVNVRQVDHYGVREGSVATVRDSTELRALAGRAELARGRLQLLYEAATRIGTRLDVARTAEELAEVATGRFADFVSVDLAESVPEGEEPDGTETVLRRTAVIGTRGGHPLHPVGAAVSYQPSAGPDTRQAVIASGLDSDNEWQELTPEDTHAVTDHGIHSLIRVPLAARGVVLGIATFWRGRHSEPFEADDLALAEEMVARAAVCIDNARRFTHEHATAATLQRNLMPRGLPDVTALDVAHRYLPAQSGVGGDWFDVIALPGTRVGLVVGDVVGHGLLAAATMGRLRTAIHNFATLDLPPDELLAHLDELVTRTDVEEAVDEERVGITGATCLYAVYDPVDGRCTIARAGHPEPALVHPDGRVEYPHVPVAPPLGLGGGVPVETAELTLAPGSQLVLYTDGLVEDRHRDFDVGQELLRTALTGAGRTPEQLCRAAFDAMVPEHPRDDIALLVARTRTLDPDRVADWDIADDPASVPPVRAACARRLADWGLEEIAFTTELIISELVTNAIRYGAEPIRLRLILDGAALICEVSDGSSTSPHLRRARATDEGGRGLFLVAQFAERWGTRYGARGKVIWTEQNIHGGTEPTADLGDLLLDQWDDTLL